MPVSPSGSEQTQRVCELRTANDRRECAVRELNRLKTVARFARAASSVLQFPLGCIRCSRFTHSKMGRPGIEPDSDGPGRSLRSLPGLRLIGFNSLDSAYTALTSVRAERCAVRELNPGSSLGKAMSYHWTNGAHHVRPETRNHSVVAHQRRVLRTP